MARRPHRILTGASRFKAPPAVPGLPRGAKTFQSSGGFESFEALTTPTGTPTGDFPVSGESDTLKGSKGIRNRMERSEHDEQARFMALLRTLTVEAARGVFAVPNGFLRTESMRLRAWREGVHPGVPDIFIPFPSKGFHGLFIEFKSARGVLTKAQNDYLTLARSRGYKAEVARSAEQALRIFSNYLSDDKNTF